MNSEIQDVESVLTEVGRRCNPRLVERKHLHARQIRSDAAEKGILFTKNAQGDLLMAPGRCRETYFRCPARSPPPMHYLRCAAAETTRFFATNRKDPGSFQTASQYPFKAQIPAAFPRRLAQPTSVPPTNSFETNRQALSFCQCHGGPDRRSLGHLLSRNELFVRRRHSSFPPGALRGYHQPVRIITREYSQDFEAVYSDVADFKVSAVTPVFRCAL